MTFKPTTSKERIEHRYKISLGHLKKVIDMVENGAYCIDVILQSQAVQKALRATDEVLLENHLKTCVTGQIKRGEADKAIQEIVTVLKNGPA